MTDIRKPSFDKISLKTPGKLKLKGPIKRSSKITDPRYNETPGLRMDTDLTSQSNKKMLQNMT